MRDQNSEKNNIPECVSMSAVDLALSVNDGVVNKGLLAQAIRVLRQNWRQGTVGCKDRSEVSFSNKKPWKQKGTGRARAGSKRSPLWRKGGVIFGPQPRVRALYLNSKMRKKMLRDLTFSFAQSSKIVSLAWELMASNPRTSLAALVLKNTGFENKKINVFLSRTDELHYHSFRNISGVNVVFFDQPNVYDLIDSDCWVFLSKDSDLFKAMVSRWN